MRRIQDQLDKLKSDLSTHIHESAAKGQEILDSVNQVTANVVTQTNLLIEAKLQPIRSFVDKHETELAFLRSQLEETQHRLAKLEKAFASPATAPPSAGSGYERIADPTVIKINCAVGLLKKDVQAGLESTLRDYQPSEFAFQGSDDTPSRFHTLTFLGPSSSAALKVNKVMALLYNSGDWIRCFAKSPSGVPQQIYLSRDKNPKQLRVEFFTKKLCKLLLVKLPEANIVQRRSKGLILVDWRQFAKIDCPDEDGEPSLQWKPSLLTQYGIDKDLLTTELLKSAKKDAEPWSG